MKVELSTVEVAFDQDHSETLGHGPWEHNALLAGGARLVPTVTLELRLLTELRRDRADRAPSSEGGGNRLVLADSRAALAAGPRDRLAWESWRAGGRPAKGWAAAPLDGDTGRYGCW